MNTGCLCVSQYREDDSSDTASGSVLCGYESLITFYEKQNVNCSAPFYLIVTSLCSPGQGREQCLVCHCLSSLQITSLPTSTESICNKMGIFLYSAVFLPQDCSKGFTLYFPGRPVQSDTISTSLGSIQPYATLNVRRLHHCL